MTIRTSSLSCRGLWPAAKNWSKGRVEGSCSKVGGQDLNSFYLAGKCPFFHTPPTKIGGAIAHPSHPALTFLLRFIQLCIAHAQILQNN